MQQSKTNETAGNSNSWNKESQELNLNTRQGWNKAMHPLHKVQQELNGVSANHQSNNNGSMRNVNEWRVPLRDSFGNVHSQAPTDGRAITKKSHQ